MWRVIAVAYILLPAVPVAGQSGTLPEIPRLGEVSPATWVAEWERRGGSPVWAPRFEGCEVGPDWMGRATIELFLDGTFPSQLARRLATYLEPGLQCLGLEDDVRAWYHRQLRARADESSEALIPFLFPLQSDTAGETHAFLREYVGTPSLAPEARDEVALIIAREGEAGLHFTLEQVLGGVVSPRGYSRIVQRESAQRPELLAEVLGEATSDHPELMAEASWIPKSALLALLHAEETDAARELGRRVAVAAEGRADRNEELVRFLRARGLVPPR